jgi:hypothetical protein
MSRRGHLLDLLLGAALIERAAQHIIEVGVPIQTSEETDRNHGLE